jgi:hypothetical protein
VRNTSELGKDETRSFANGIKRSDISAQSLTASFPPEQRPALAVFVSFRFPLPSSFDVQTAFNRYLQAV